MHQNIYFGIKDIYARAMERANVGQVVSFALASCENHTLTGKVFSKTILEHGTLLMIENHNKSPGAFGEGWPYFAFWASPSLCGQSGLVEPSDPQIGWFIKQEAGRIEAQPHNIKAMKDELAKLRLEVRNLKKSANVSP